MKIITRTTSDNEKYLCTELGIDKLFFKYISNNKDRGSIVRKRHFHTGFEVHIITSGHQIYEFDDIDHRTLKADIGDFLMIPPLCPHSLIDDGENTAKYAFTFSINNINNIINYDSVLSVPILKKLPSVINSNIDFICEKSKKQDPISASLAYGRVLESVYILLIEAGLTLNSPLPSESTASSNEDNRLVLAKQYVKDNVKRPISVDELAAYCCISPKQLSRLFKSEESMSVAEYIRKERCYAIEALLSDPSLSLREISETMSFNNEYHFNSFFKKYSGMTPGSYRKGIKINI